MSNKPFSGRTELAVAFLALKQELSAFFDHHPDQDVTGFTLAVNMERSAPIMYHKSSSVDGADLAVLMTIIEDLAVENVAMEYIPLARAVRVICNPTLPTYAIFTKNDATSMNEFFACANPDFLQNCYETLGRILTGQIENQLAKESREFRGESDPSNVIPFPPKPTKH